MRTHRLAEVRHEVRGEEVVVCGWLHEVRDLGGVRFLILRDFSGFLQVTLRRDLCSEEVFEVPKRLSRESVLRIRGVVKVEEKAPRGVELIPKTIEVLSEAEKPLPLDVTEKVKADLDTRLENRFLDLRRSRIAVIFKLRDRVIEAGRHYLRSQGFLEVQSPKIIASASEGGATLFPISYFEREAFLAQSPQLYKQMLMAAGFERVYELATYFRAEEHDTRRHLNEVVALDAEMSFISSEEDVMKVLERLVAEMIEAALGAKEELELVGAEPTKPELPFERVSYDEALKLLAAEGKRVEWGSDPDTEAEKLLGEIMLKEYEAELYFITKYPLEARPFYTMPEGKLTRSFDLAYRGVEVCSGGQRIHDHDLLVRRIKECNLNPENFEFYLKAFRYGVPPHGGFGLGVERLMMQLLGLKQIREVVLFPRDRHRLTP